MPFTLAHPAAVWPVRRLPLLRTVPLIIGSLTPDLPDFLPGQLARHFPWTHSLRASVKEDLPLGLLVLILVVLLRAPLTELLGSRTRRLVHSALTVYARDPRAWLLAPLSLLVGTWTHLLWDSFTHEGGWVTRHVAALRAPVSLGAFYTGPLEHILQYVSSVVGLALVVLWYQRSVAGMSPLPAAACRVQLPSPRLRNRVLAGVLVAALAVGVAQAAGPAHGQALYRVFYLLLTRPLAWFALLYLLAGLVLCLRRTYVAPGVAGTQARGGQPL